MAKQIIMTSPALFEVADKNAAAQQWNTLRNTLLGFGVDVIVMPAGTGEVTTSSIGAIFKNKFFGTYANDNAQAVVEAQVESWFKSRDFEMGFTNIASSRSQGKFSGKDISFDVSKKLIWFGFNFTSSLGFKYVIDRAFEDTELVVRPLEMVDSRFKSLDSCFCLLDTGDVLWYPPAFSEHSRYVLDLWYGDKLIEIDESDALRGACNSISVGKNLIMPIVSSKLVARLESKGYETIEVNLDQFFKNGGCKSLTLQVYE